MATQRVSQMTVATPQTRYKNLGGNWNNFAAGNQSADDLKAFLASIVGRPAQAVSAGGTFTINNQSLGSYDYTIKQGDQTVSSFVAGDWFTTTEDTRSALITVNGNLTINSGQTFTPSVRKLFTCIYVNGNLTVNGTISMSSRGANHSATSAATIKLINNGTYGGVTNPEIPATGGAGVGANSDGTAGTNGGTGAGGGGRRSGGAGGNGAAGTSFSGGAAGGSAWNATSGSGVANGGAGGNGACGGSGANAGGAGNPGGSGCGSATASSAGTGGVLIIYVTGTYSGTGSITASGATGGGCTGDCHAAGSGSGGGSVSIFCTTNSTGPTPTATGGSRGNMGGNGGDRFQGLFGGAGTARIMAGAF